MPRLLLKEFLCVLSQHVEVVSGRTRSYCYGALNQLQCSGSCATRRLFLILQTSRLYRTMISALTYTGPNAADTSKISSHISLLSALGLYFLVLPYFRQISPRTLAREHPKRETDRPDPFDRSDPSNFGGQSRPQGLAGWGCLATMARIESTRMGPVCSPRLVRET